MKRNRPQPLQVETDPKKESNNSKKRLEFLVALKKLLKKMGGGKSKQ